jgi:hypothetical protein
MNYTQSNPIAIALCFLSILALHANTALAQSGMTAEEEAIYRKMVESTGIDPDAQMKAIEQNNNAQQWTDAEVIHYSIVGVYEGEAMISSQPGTGSGYADVTDGVVIELDWNLPETKLVGTPSIENDKSVVSNLHDSEPSCLPPILKGDYEHFDLLGIKDGLAGSLEMQVQTSHPAIEVVQFCTGSRKTIPAGLDTRPESFGVPSPVLITMALPDSDSVSVSPDKKSIIQKKDGWTWTFTPSVKK